MLLLKDYLEANIKQIRHQGGNGRISNRPDIAKLLGISKNYLNEYLKGVLPSLKVAKAFYINTGLVLHPYSEESIKYEIEKDKNV